MTHEFSRSHFALGAVGTSLDPRRVFGRRTVLFAALLLLCTTGQAVAEKLAAEADVAVREADVLALWEGGQPGAEAGHAFAPAGKLLGGEPVAFEEHPLFVYAIGRSPELVRRVVFFKPSTFVIDDWIKTAGPVRWREDSLGQITSVTLLPEGGIVSRPGKPGEAAVVEATPRPGEDGVHLVRVLHVGEGKTQPKRLHREGGRIELSAEADGRTFYLALPAASETGGKIEISAADGGKRLQRRLLPAGVLPHDPLGIGLLERWDSRYRREGRPGWDTGRPSSELKKAVEEGTLRPCRVVELGCGTGTNAIYLAQKGFDVTAIDIAPTALALAEQKAAKAGVEARWVLANVLNPPELGPFDLVYDRGCYHGVRQQNAAGYVAALGQLSQSGTRVLILAGSANNPNPRGGPPRVKEEEIRSDFSKDFEIEWLRETRFDTRDADAQGAVAWSILLRRK